MKFSFPENIVNMFYCIAAFNLESLQAGTLDMDHMTPQRTDATRIRDEPAAQDSLRTGALR